MSYDLCVFVLMLLGFAQFEANFFLCDMCDFTACLLFECLLWPCNLNKKRRIIADWRVVMGQIKTGTVQTNKPH